MKGSTHALIGLATTGVMLNTPIGSSQTLLSLAAAYTGALLCDIDMGNSTISHELVPIKSRHIKKLLAVIYFIVGIGVLIYFKNTTYFPITAAVVVIGGLSFNRISSGTYKFIRKVMLAGIAAALVTAGVLYKQYPLVAIGGVLGVLMFSPHRGYSHSLIAVGVSYAAVKYICEWYKLYDVSLFFAVGMMSHIIADMFTTRGAAMLFPYHRHIHFPVTMKTGSKGEYVVGVLALGVVVVNLLGRVGW